MVNTWADLLNRAGLGMEVMHERNAHNFPLDLASNNIVPVALKADRSTTPPAIYTCGDGGKDRHRCMQILDGEVKLRALF